MKKVLLIFITLAVVLGIWGCSKNEPKEVPTDAPAAKQELSQVQRLAAKFLFQLTKNYGNSDYSIKLYDVKAYSDDKTWYYVSAEAELAGFEEGARMRFGNEVAFHINEDISFTSKESSAYKFLTKSNKASEKGETLDVNIITSELSRLIKEQQAVDKANEQK